MLYKELYYYLYAAVADAVEELDSGHPEAAAEILVNALHWAEDTYIEHEEGFNDGGSEEEDSYQ